MDTEIVQYILQNRRENKLMSKTEIEAEIKLQVTDVYGEFIDFETNKENVYQTLDKLQKYKYCKNMEDLNKEPINSVSSNADLEKKEERKEEDLTDEKFLVEAEKVVNRIIQQYDKLLELSKKHHVEDKDANFMFNELKKVHDSTKKTFKEVDKTSGFSFK